MFTRKYKPEQMVNLLRQVGVAIATGETTPQAAREVGITEQIYYRWREEFGTLEVGKAFASSGNETGAKAAYQDFLRLRKGADSGIPILNQAKAEYAELK